MKEYMANSSHEKFLADGFPRSQENIDAWHEVIGDEHSIEFLLLFDLSPEDMKKRLMSRAAKNKAAGKELRSDDKSEVMDKRIKLFFNSTPIFDQFETAGNLRRVDAHGSIDEIFGRVEKVFKDGGLI